MSSRRADKYAATVEDDLDRALGLVRRSLAANLGAGYTEVERAAMAGAAVAEYGTIAQRHVPAPLVDQVVATAMEAAVWGQWHRHRAIYRWHPAIVDALADTEADVQIPVDALRHLPHPNPCFVLDTPIVHHEGGQAVEWSHLLVAGAVGDDNTMRIVSTANEFTGLMVNFVGSVKDDTGQVVDREIRRTLLRFRDGATPASMADEIVARFTHDDSAPRPSDDEFLANTRAQVQMAVAMLLYVASPEPDLDRWPDPEIRSKKARRRATSPFVVADVGWSVGQLLAADTTRSAESDHSGRSVRPHVRRAHWRRSRVGPRDDWRYALRWIHPTVVNVETGEPAAGVIVDTGPPPAE